MNFHPIDNYSSSLDFITDYLINGRKYFPNHHELPFFVNYNQNDNDEFTSPWWIFITIKNTHQNDGFHRHDGFSSKCLFKKKDNIFSCAYFSPKLCILIKMKIDSSFTNFCIKFFIFISMMNYQQNISLLWEFFMAMIDLNHRASFHHFDLF